MPWSKPIKEVPFENATACTPNDATTFHTTRGLYIGGAGNVRVDLGDGAVTFNGVLAGTIYPFRVTRVYNTGTTATNIVRLY